MNRWTRRGAPAEDAVSYWDAFDDEGASAREERMRRRRFVRRMRVARIAFAATCALSFAVAALWAFRFIGAYAAAFRSLSDRGAIDDVAELLEALGVRRLDFLVDNHQTVALVLALVLLFLATLSATMAAGLFLRLYRSSGRALYHLYGQPSVVGPLVFMTLLAAVALPYAVDLLWSRGAVAAPRLEAALGYGAGLAAAFLVSLRASQLARRPLPGPVEALPDVGAPERKSRAAVCARDPLARAAFERLLADNGFVIVFSSEYAEETRTFFRRRGRGADVLLLNDDVEDMAALRFITHLADEAESAIGLVRLSRQGADPNAGRRSDEPRGRIVAIEHVRTPTTRAPLVEATTRAADAARDARAEAPTLSEARGALSG